MNVVVSKVLAATVLMDSTANGKLYVSPISLWRDSRSMPDPRTEVTSVWRATRPTARAHRCRGENRGLVGLEACSR
jgi:hypothetical protein